MTVRTQLHCNGQVGGRACRMCVTVGAMTVAKARARVEAEGWTSESNLDYCPTCSRRRASIRGRHS